MIFQEMDTPSIIIGTTVSNYNIIMVKINRYLSDITFSLLIRFLRNNGYMRVNSWKVWYKSSDNLDNDMNELENFLIDNDISYINTHPYFKTYRCMV